MKREEIVRSDFPTERRGYQRAAVDAHLRRVADGVGSGSLAEVAAQKVATIVEAAEAKAREIEADARREAEQLLGDARAQAREQVERAQDSVAALVGQADDLRQRVGGLMREVVDSEMPQPEPAPQPGPQPVPEPAPPEPEVDPSPTIVPEPEPPREPEPAPPTIPEPQPDQPPPAAVNGSEDEQAARLVAMKMALDGSSREEIERHLEASYSLGDTASLLDQVLARAGR